MAFWASDRLDIVAVRSDDLPAGRDIAASNEGQYEAAMIVSYVHCGFVARVLTARGATKTTYERASGL